MIRGGFELACGVPGKARPRVTRHGTYMPRKYVQAVATIKEAARGAWGADDPCAVALTLRVSVRRAAPKRLKGRERDTMRPDVDNVLGTVMDALQGVVYRNDSQVVAVLALKKDRIEGMGPLLSVEWEIEGA